MAASTKSVPLRLPEELYNAIRDLSKSSGESMNSVILGSIADMLKARERAKLYESFTLLGGDADSDVEFAFAAQKEAVGD